MVHRTIGSHLTENIRYDGGAWITRKIILVWAISTVQKILNLLGDHKYKLVSTLESIPPDANRLSGRIWHRLLGITWIVVPAISGAMGMFTRLHHVLKTENRWIIALTTPARDKWKPVAEPCRVPPHPPKPPRDILPPPPFINGSAK